MESQPTLQNLVIIMFFDCEYFASQQPCTSLLRFKDKIKLQIATPKFDKLARILPNLEAEDGL